MTRFPVTRLTVAVGVRLAANRLFPRLLFVLLPLPSLGLGVVETRFDPAPPEDGTPPLAPVPAVEEALWPLVVLRPTPPAPPPPVPLLPPVAPPPFRLSFFGGISLLQQHADETSRNSADEDSPGRSRLDEVTFRLDLQDYSFFLSLEPG
jgi:hypothetical protein